MKKLRLSLPGKTFHGIEMIFNNLKDEANGFFINNKKLGKRIKSDFLSLFKKSMVGSVIITKDNGHHVTIKVSYDELCRFMEYVENRIEVVSGIDKSNEGIALSHLSPDVCFIVEYKNRKG